MKSTRFYSKKQEKAVAKSLGGRTVANSGATLWADGDVSVSRHFLIECKTTMTPKSSFSIKKEWLTKIEKERLLVGKEDCALAFNFSPNEQSYYVISEKTFKQYIEYLRQCDESNG